MKHNHRALLAASLLLVVFLAACGAKTTPGGQAAAYPAPQSPPLATRQSPDTPVTAPAYPAPGEPGPAPWQPLPGDSAMQRGEANINRSEILILESFPPQFRLTLQGVLPTPCHKLRVQVPEPDDQNRIQVEVYSVVDPLMICIQVLQEFEVSVPLENLPAGQIYSVWVNGIQVGEVNP
ncbi:MAG: hypothetical protein AB1894_09095 [Chloroflexota bacterium]